MVPPLQGSVACMDGSSPQGVALGCRIAPRWGLALKIHRAGTAPDSPAAAPHIADAPATHFHLNEILTPSVATLRFYRLLLSVRPTQFGSVLKSLFGIRRRLFRTTAGHVFWLDPVSVFGLELMTTGDYEPELSAIVKALLRRGDTFVDVGGNEGYFSILAADRVGNGHVHCIEPQSRLVPVLEENRRQNAAVPMSIHPFGLAADSGRATLFLRPGTNTGASSMFRHWKIGRTAEIVPIRSMDDFFQEAGIDAARLMKVDCEGAEHMVIDGGSRTLAEHRVDFIALEFHPHIGGQQKCFATHCLLEKHGYRLATVNGHWMYCAPGVEEDLRALRGVRAGLAWETAFHDH